MRRYKLERHRKLAYEQQVELVEMYHSFGDDHFRAAIVYEIIEALMNTHPTNEVVYPIGEPGLVMMCHVQQVVRILNNLGYVSGYNWKEGIIWTHL